MVLAAQKRLKTNVEYRISEFNKMVKSITTDKFNCGSKVEFMNLVIYEESFFCILTFQKEQNLYAYIPRKSNSQKHTIKNYALNELKWYIKF